MILRFGVQPLGCRMPATLKRELRTKRNTGGHSYGSCALMALAKSGRFRMLPKLGSFCASWAKFFAAEFVFSRLFERMTAVFIDSSASGTLRIIVCARARSYHASGLSGNAFANL